MAQNNTAAEDPAAVKHSASNSSLASVDSEACEKVDDEVAKIEHNLETAHVSTEDNGSKFQIILGLLKKMIGVKDIVNMRISLPAQLLDPISNLEYWTYMDRPDFFSVLSDPDDPVERMVNVVRWYLSKDLKFVKNKVVKAYNSILGERFIAHFDVHPAPPAYSGKLVPSGPETAAYDKGTSAAAADKKPSASSSKRRVEMFVEQISHHPPVSAFCYECPEKKITARGLDHICAKFTGTAVRVAPGEENRGIYVVLGERDNEEYACTHPNAYINGWLRGSLYLTVSDYAVITCEKTGLQAVLEYKEEKWFSKAKNAIEVRIFKLKGSPAPIPTASLSTLNSSPSLASASNVDDGAEAITTSSSDATAATKSKKTTRSTSKSSITSKKDKEKSKSRESGLSARRLGGSTVSLADYDSTAWTHHAGGMAMKEVYLPEREGETLVKVTGSWRAEMAVEKVGDKPVPFLDMQNIQVLEKRVPPLSAQNPNESRAIWRQVSEAIHRKDFNEATRLKQALEEKQRARAQERKKTGEEFVSALFVDSERWGRSGVPISLKEREERRTYLPKSAFAGTEVAGDTVGTA